MEDQAHSLKDTFENFSQSEVRPTHTISITSGKGGVGKTTLTINIADELARIGKKVLICDADLGLANVDLMLGIKTRLKLADIVKNNLKARDVVAKTSIDGVDLLASSSGLEDLTALGDAEQTIILNELAELSREYDYLLIDTGAGISSNILRFNATADHMVFVVTPELTSIMDCFATMKAMWEKFECSHFKLIANQASQQKAIYIYQALTQIKKNINKPWKIHLLGNIPDNPRLIRHALRQRSTLAQLLNTAGFNTNGKQVLSALETVVRRLDQNIATQVQQKDFWKRWGKDTLHLAEVAQIDEESS